jgi:hypothetical protein
MTYLEQVFELDRVVSKAEVENMSKALRPRSLPRWAKVAGVTAAATGLAYGGLKAKDKYIDEPKRKKRRDRKRFK